MTERTYKKDLEVINLVRLSLLKFSEFVIFDFISGGRGAAGGGADLIKQNLRLSILPLNQPYRNFMDFIKWSP